MARRVKDSVLDTREARQRLKVRGKPYWRAIERGLHVGYRRLKGKAGTWWARHYIGNQEYETESLGIADDLSDADGVAVLSFWQAQDEARNRMVSRAHVAAGKTGPLSVADVMEDYHDFIEANRKSVADVRNIITTHILPALGDIEVSALTTEEIRDWHRELANTPARIRSKNGEQKFKKSAQDAETKRRRRTTVNRALTVLKAALNRAWRDGKITSNQAWARVEPFKNIDAARMRYLTIAEAKRLINACAPDFRNLVQAALQTGARYAELAALRVEDFNPDVGTIAVRQSETGKPRHVVLTHEGIGFFTQLTAARRGSELMLPKSDGTAWRKSHATPRIHEACNRANIDPPITFHGLRHTWASLAVMSGVPLLVVAKNLGHRDTRMVEHHYGHLAPSYIVDAIRQGAPKFGFKPDKNIVTIGR